MKEFTSLPFHPSSSQTLRSALKSYGFACIKQAFSPEEVDLLERAVDDLLANAPDAGNYTWRSPATDGNTIVQRVSRANLFSTAISANFMNADQLSIIGSWIFDAPPGRIRIADGSEGSDGIVLVVKHPTNGSVHRELRWHKDETFTQHLPMNPFVNCGLYLDQSDDLRGGLLVIPGTHRSFSHDAVQETTRQVPEQVCVLARPGDLVVHRADIWHRSGPHQVPGEVRRVLYANLYAQ